MNKVFVSVNDITPNDYKWIDTRFSLQNVDLGLKKYEEAHVSGATYWHLERDLSDMQKKNGRHPMPDKDSLIELFQKSGLSLADNIIVYDDGGSPFAARAWWILQYAGFTNSYIALEGFEAIKNAGIPVDSEVSNSERTSVSPVWDEAIYVDRSFVEKTVANETSSLLLDARAAERYRGEVEPLDPIAGRIPGALNFDWEQLKEDGQFIMGEAFQEKLGETVDPSQEITVYCGSGVTAAPLYAMLAHYGYSNLHLYVGSYSDWISEEGAIVEKD
ncbi:sulfurtransferase [Sporosarcina sp. CAU 1771]